jgi:PEP-CTERM motif
MRKHLSLLTMLIVCSGLAFRVSEAKGESVISAVRVDTSSISGTTGSLDLNFNPGPLVTQPASLQILDLTSDGMLAGNCPCVTGDVTGQLPSTLTFDNGSGFNDYFDNFTFKQSMSFHVSFYGAALSTPDGTSTSGSTFAFSMFSDAVGIIPTLTTDTTDGFAFTINVNFDGTTTVTNYSSQTSVNPLNGAATPEPSTLALIGIGGVVFAGFVRRRKRKLLLGSVPQSPESYNLASKPYLC